MFLILITREREREMTVWPGQVDCLLVGRSEGVGGAALRPTGCLSQEEQAPRHPVHQDCEEQQRNVFAGGGDQSDCGGLLTRPRPDPEELRSQRGGGVPGPVQRVPPAGGHQPPGARHGDGDEQSRQSGRDDIRVISYSSSYPR